MVRPALQLHQKQSEEWYDWKAVNIVDPPAIKKRDVHDPWDKDIDFAGSAIPRKSTIEHCVGRADLLRCSFVEPLPFINKDLFQLFLSVIIGEHNEIHILYIS